MKKEKLHFIYKITCVLNNKFYIGMHSTYNIKDGYMGSGIHINRSIKKHGKNNHFFEILTYAPSRDQLCLLEKQYILNHKDELCMNLTEGGLGGSTRKGQRHSSETKNKIKNSLLGHFVSEETKERISLNRKGKGGYKLSKEAREKISIANTGKVSKYKGIPRSEETKLKISNANKGKYFGNRSSPSDETRKKISQANKGKVVSEIQKKKLSERMKGNNPSEETRKKLSEKAKEQWKRYRENKYSPVAQLEEAIHLECIK